MAAPFVLINGSLESTLSPMDRGLAYGDGLFETFRISHGHPELWDYHWQRLQAGCARLNIPLDPSLAQLVRDEFRELVALSGLQEGAGKLLLTRGSGGRGYRIAEPPPAPTRITSLSALPQYPTSWETAGVRVRICETRLARQPLLAGLKHLNRLEQVLARNEWQDPAIAEGLLLDAEGMVIEGTMSNLFLVHNQQLVTPSLCNAGVEGVMRRRVIELYQNATGRQVEVRDVQLDELHDADELFLTNSLIGIWPVRQLGTQAFAVGALSLELQALLATEEFDV